MNVVLIGSNGLLANSIGKFCSVNNYDLTVIGLEEPAQHTYSKFIKTNLINEKIKISEVLFSDVIIYAVGAGIQSNLNEDAELIYNLNVSVPVDICNQLNKLNYQGAFVTFGSYFEIGSNVDNKKYTEIELSVSANPVPNDYCVSKRMLTRFVTSKVQKIKHLHLILPTIYGEQESSHRLIPYTIKAIKNNTELNFTSGDQTRQYLYIDDVAILMFQCIEKSALGIYNISGFDTYTVKEIVKRIFEFYNKPFTEEVFGKTLRNDVGMVNLQIDSSKLYGIIHDFKYTHFSESIKKYDLCL